MAALFWSLALLCAVCVGLVLAVDYRVERASSWESIDRWLLIASHAFPVGLILFGATVGVGLAWWIA